MAEPHFNGPLAHLVRSVFRARRPDPWPTEIDRAVRDPQAEALCLHCLFPQGPHPRFCPHCGIPTGHFVALMPYEKIFVLEEVLRRGVMGPPQKRVGAQLFLVALSTIQYAVFAPIYWFWMLRRAQGRPICPEVGTHFENEEKP